jgi:hypothetical protein
MKLSKNTKKFISAVSERAIKTFAQAFLASIGANTVFAVSGLEALQIALSASVISVITSLASAQFGSHGPSLASESVVNDEVAGH